MDKKPWWWPEHTDAAWCDRIRREYDEALSDDDIRDKYAGSRKYAVLWDHVGDAYDQFEKLADHFLSKEK